jgi:hypothetical protein
MLGTLIVKEREVVGVRRAVRLTGPNGGQSTIARVVMMGRERDVSSGLMMCGVLGLRIRRGVQKLRRESIRADLERERPVGGGHEARRNERAHRKRHQQDADEPLVCTPAEKSESHPLET